MDVTPSKIAAQIRSFLESAQRISDGQGDAAFDMPLIGYAGAPNPLFDQARGADGAGIHPTKWLEAKYGEGWAPERACVISWALPMPASVRGTMHGPQRRPSYAWIAARAKAERINLGIARSLAAWFDAHGIRAVAPIAEAAAQRRNVELYGAGLPWSEPIAAIAAGVAALRPSCGVVTRAGSSVVLGSIVAATRFPGEERGPLPLDGLCKLPEGCTACRDRCPIGAITDGGFDYARCLKYQSQFVLPYLKGAYGYDGRIGCDLCVTDVPCECFPDRP